MQWTAQLALGIESIDQQHRKIVDMINELHAAMLGGRANLEVWGILIRLNDYTEQHFAYEEQLFSEHGYPGEAEHKADHDRLIGQLKVLEEKAQRGSLVIGRELFWFLNTWLREHILHSDRQYVELLRARGVT